MDMTAPLPAASALSAEQTRERLGAITRQLHEAIVQLGLDGPIKAVTDQIPDARDRLDYVGQMTERAAHKVLGLVEQAQPLCGAIEARSATQGATLAALLADADASPQALRTALTRAQAAFEADRAEAARQQALWSEVMMTQDFQDLSGQVIKKVVRIISDTETHLLSLLIDSDPAMGQLQAQRARPEPAALEGPQLPDNALGQGDVDDLLASMGF